jgi:dTDP-4-dehydrorhamnose 3,5-epimerase-like enzyme
MKKIQPYMLKNDNRGKILGITQNTWEEINYIESIKDSVRGDHYHKETLEAFYIISGEIKVEVVNINNNKKEEFIAKSSEIFIIEPYELHTFTALTDSSWVNMLSKNMKNSEDFYKNN